MIDAIALQHYSATPPWHLSTTAPLHHGTISPKDLVEQRGSVAVASPFLRQQKAFDRLHRRQQACLLDERNAHHRLPFLHVRERGEARESTVTSFILLLFLFISSFFSFPSYPWQINSFIFPPSLPRSFLILLPFPSSFPCPFLGSGPEGDDVL